MNRRLFFAAVASVVLGRPKRVEMTAEDWINELAKPRWFTPVLEKYGRTTYLKTTKPLPSKTLGRIIPLVNLTSGE